MGTLSREVTLSFPLIISKRKEFAPLGANFLFRVDLNYHFGGEGGTGSHESCLPQKKMMKKQRCTSEGDNYDLDVFFALLHRGYP